VGCNDKKLYAVNPDGTEKWSFETGDRITSSPVVGADGNIYFGSHDNRFYSLKPDGTLDMIFLTYGRILSSPTIDVNGNIYVSSEDNKLYAISSGSLGLADSPWPKVGHNTKNDASTHLKTENNSFTTASMLYPGLFSGLTCKGEDWYKILVRPSDIIDISILFSHIEGDLDLRLYDESGVELASSVTTTDNETLSYKNASDIEKYVFIKISGYSANPTNYEIFIESTGRSLWSFEDSRSGCQNSPVLDMNGDIYSCSNQAGIGNSYLYALSDDRTKKWEFEIGGWQYSSATIGNDGTIYVGSNDNKLYAINPDGTEKWTFETDGQIYSSPVIGDDGIIYVGNTNGKLYSINSDGTEKWSFETSGAIFSSPVIGSDGVIFVGNNDAKLYAINPDGTEKWVSGEASSYYNSSPAISSDGTIYVGGGGRLYAIDLDGMLKWTFLTNDVIDSTPAIDTNNIVYFTNRDGLLYAINPNGTMKWNFRISGKLTWPQETSSPVIDSSNIIYVGSIDKKLYAINMDGTLEWAVITEGEVETAPVIGSDKIYVRSGRSDEFLSAFSLSTDL
jgi:outer membrane protein assembly factor BamB